ncbi:Multi antimicrobial extrusion protein [Corchorus olitorius]|uniref:Protein DETOXIFICATION n=1 Tax=Corchorus olitorius TaxID=93759 RepID=A0A1R3FU82_9ROSI|nr:Multi antimicrobial extrusion protein [Corchorus olitorius]
MDNNLQERLLTSHEEERRDLKTRVWIESKAIWRVAFPSMLTRVTSFGMIIITQSFLGHISEVELATYALIQSILVRFVNGILIGMSSATETLCGQAFGAKHYHMMGIYLQRSWIVDGATATLVMPLFIFATPLLKLLGQEEEIANAAGRISLWFIPMVYSMVFSMTIQMYLQAQLKNLVVGWLSFTTFICHIFLSWLMVYKLNWGVNGAMASLNIASWAMVIAEFVYVFGGWCPLTWQGFSKAAFFDILPVLKLSIASGVMVCLELWYNAILVLLAGYMKNATIAIDAFSICANINGWEFMICLGFLGASIVRVANELGRGNAAAVKFSIKTILATSTAFGVFFWILCLVFGDQISYFFTDDERVAKAVSSLSTLLAFSILLNSVQPVLSGVATGAGLQSTVALVNLGSYYAVGLPIGIVLGYVLNYQVQGLWIGLLSGVFLQTVILAIIVWRTNWDDQVKKAYDRLNRWLIKPEGESTNKESESLA